MMATARAKLPHLGLKHAFVLTGLMSALGCAQKETEEVLDCSAPPSKLFEKRVAPLFEEEHPNTCAQCHAGGIDLERFLRPDACESMACLQADGLVDLENPEASVLLSFIDRAEPDNSLITEEVIAEERSAFLGWIEHEAECGGCEGVECGERSTGDCDSQDMLDESYSPAEDPGDCDRETLEKLFRGTVYFWRGRCSPCHFQEEETADERAPRWLSRTGDCQVASLASLRKIEESGYIDSSDAKSSLLLLKPLAEFDGGVPHIGHDKLLANDDPAYDNFLHFLDRYVACETKP